MDGTKGTNLGKRLLLLGAVGIAYACQALPAVPHEAHDERLDFVLTETELIVCHA